MNPYLTLLTAVVLMATGCARPIEGSYVDEHGVTVFRLAEGKYYGTSVADREAKPARVAGREAMPIPLPYKVDGSRLIVHKRGGDAVLDIMDDGTLRRSGSAQRYARR